MESEPQLDIGGPNYVVRTYKMGDDCKIDIRFRREGIDGLVLDGAVLVHGKSTALTNAELLILKHALVREM